MNATPSTATRTTPASAISISLLTVAGLALAHTGTVSAQAASVEDLDQRIRILERKLEIEKEAAETAAKKAPTIKADASGLNITSPDFAFQFKALVQLDGRWFLDDDDALRSSDTFTFRRIRPNFQGTVGKLVGYRLTPEFAGSGATIVDAYIDLKFSPAATVRAGKVKGPVGLERLQGGGAISFVERGLPTELAPNRDIGVQLQGDLANKTLSYVVGVYNGTRDGADGADVDNNGRKEVAARLFYEPVKGIGFGIAGSHGSKRGATEAPRNYATPDRVTRISYNPGTSYDGDATRISPQGYFYSGPFGLLGEYIVSTQELTRTTTGDSPVTTRGEIDNSAWQLLGTYVITGEDASYAGVKPRQPFAVGTDGWGALELAVRYGKLEADDEALTQTFVAANSVETIENLGAGLNWYLNGNVKLVLNYNQTSYSNFSGPDRDDDKSIFTRLQLAF